MMHNRNFQRWLWVLFSTVVIVQCASLSSSPTPAFGALSNTSFTASGTASPASLTQGQTLTITGTFTAKQALSNVNVDLEIRSTSHAKLLQKYYLGESFASGQTKTYTWNVVMPATMAPATYNVAVAVFSANWGTAHIWYEPATTFQVVSGAVPGTVPAAPSGLVAAVVSSSQIDLTWADHAGNESGFKIERSLDGTSYAQIDTVGAGVQAYANTGLTASTRYYYRVRAYNSAGNSGYSNAVSAVTSAGSTGGGYFATLPPGSALPNDCASRVRAAAERRPENDGANHTIGITGVNVNGSSAGFMSRLGYRVNGSFTGTTDEILQWGACKWGLDEDIQRARAVQESSWRQSQLGDYSTSSSLCALIGKSAPCYQSYGLLQIKGTVHGGSYPISQLSTPFNVDYSLAWQRACFEGDLTWLGSNYRAGDIWGCVGAWFSGSWYDAGAQDYINKVKTHLLNRIWGSY